jgi:hypothetical protein
MPDPSDEDAPAHGPAPNTNRSAQPTPEHPTDPAELSQRGTLPDSLEVPVSYERRSTDPEVLPRVSAPRARREVRASGETTLLSAPAPADPREIEIDDRLDAHDRRLAQLDERMEMLARTISRLEKPSSSPRASWLVWVGFLLLLALLWQLSQWLR